MPTATAPPRAKRETWRDWMVPGTPEPTDLITRDEVIERLHDRGVSVTPRTLANWESIGATPRPIRRWRDGAPRALYPAWVVDIAAQVPGMLRHEGIPLHDVGSDLRQQIWPPDAVVMLPDGSRLGGVFRAARPKPLEEATDTAIKLLTERYLRATGLHITRIEIRVTDERGVSIEGSFNPTETPDSE
jgi:hypothetical protein